ncbi:COMMD7 [Blepharisma stoltei]|uniref:COMM domain-containing protein n=1 Tax=Blepharisma stoltei TaxID=1481888 RepID=A0AAU9J5G0_9CILI|nr:unnamed protein product [Blepharisma stoltei]
MAFNFLPLEYDLGAELLADLRSLSSLPDAALEALSSICLQYLQNSSLQPQHFYSALDDVELPVKQRESAARTLILFFRFSAKKVLNRTKILEDLHQLGFNENISARIGTLWDQNKVGACKVMLGQIGVGHELVDMEWKFGVTYGNKFVNAKGECFVQLKFVIQTPDKKRNEIFLEVTPRQFYDLYGDLEKIKAIMDIHS